MEGSAAQSSRAQVVHLQGSVTLGKLYKLSASTGSPVKPTK